MNLAKGFYHVIADPSGVRNGRVFSNPDPLVDTTTQMFSKVAIHILIDSLLALVCIDDETIHSYFPFTFLLLTFRLKGTPPCGDMPRRVRPRREGAPRLTTAASLSSAATLTACKRVQ